MAVEKLGLKRCVPDPPESTMKTLNEAQNNNFLFMSSNLKSVVNSSNEARGYHAVWRILWRKYT